MTRQPIKFAVLTGVNDTSTSHIGSSTDKTIYTANYIYTAIPLYERCAPVVKAPIKHTCYRIIDWRRTIGTSLIYRRRGKKIPLHL